MDDPMGVPLIPKDDIIVLVLDFLKQNGYAQAQRALEGESGKQLDIAGREIEFVRGLILDGLWEDAESFLEPLMNHDRFDHAAVLYALRRQQYLELLHAQQLSKAVVHLVDRLKPLERAAPRAELPMLCYALTLPRLTEHPDFRRWSPAAGRAACATVVVPHLEVAYGPQEPQPHHVPPNRLVALLRRLLSLEAAMATSRGHVAPAPASLLSDAWDTLPSARDAVSVPPHHHATPMLEAPSSPDGDIVRASVDGQSSLHHHEAQPQPRHSRAEPEPRDRRGWRCAAVASAGHTLRTVVWSARAASLAVGGNAGTVHVAGGASRALQTVASLPTTLAVGPPLMRHEGSVYCLAWANNLLASGGNDRAVQICKADGEGPSCDPSAMAPLTLYGHHGVVRGLEFVGRGMLASAGREGVVCLWDAATGATVARWTAHEDGMGALAATPVNPDLLLTAGGTSATLWDVRTRRAAATASAAPFGCVIEAAALQHDSQVAALAIDEPSPSAGAEGAGFLAFVDWRTRRVAAQARPHVGRCRAVDFAPGGGTVVSGGFDGLLSLVSAVDGAAVTVASHGGRVAAVRWHPALSSFASCGTDGCARIWTIDS